MELPQYHFVTRWEIEAPQKLLYELLSEPLHYPVWMKSLHLRVWPIDKGAADGVGRVDRYEMRAFFPYSLRWNLKCTAAQKPERILSEASGDMEGIGEWTFQSVGKKTAVQFDWKVRVRTPFLRYSSPLLRPFFTWNHDWVMRRWERDLRQEVSRKSNDQTF